MTTTSELHTDVLVLGSGPSGFAAAYTATQNGAKVILVAREDFNVDKEAYDYIVKVPQMDNIMMPIPTAIPLQLIAYYTSVHRGNDVDKPRNLAKSVTVE